ncbi:helix-turn-helix transcriptional regulator [Mycetohabitans sp. B2]|jgi:AraC-like DNA-binding protein|uniref:helix-turn-helix transcriptional regulator n=1 Tax=Mycetohabitans TaxID=2571159 RepID=UPI001F3B42A3|nr:helix-turn-helix transcriptional regulator [Mycetohabitans sp. B2]MCF7697504.1 helix-turn-helix transcriptional regulator [Mycetohabitans sp. B2]
MLITPYFPLAAALSSKNVPAEFMNKLIEANLTAAGGQASRWGEDEREDQQVAGLLQLHADMQMTLGIDDEAETSYRRAQRAVRECAHAVRAASCRNAGWQALFRCRLATALSCFVRLVDDAELDPLQRLEAQFGLVCALHELGQGRFLRDAIKQLIELTEEAPPEVAQRWQEVVLTLRLDIAVQRELRLSSQLGDHAYWLSGAVDERSLGSRDSGALIEALETDAQRVQMPLLKQRIMYLRHLRLLSHGVRDAMMNIQQHLDWAARNGLSEYGRSTRIEIGLAALHAGAPQLAESVVESLNRVDYVSSTGRRQIDYLYCLAKIRQSQGKVNESMQYYTRYAVVSTQCLRDDSQALVSFSSRATPQTGQLDDISARLPAKYRRAYRYMQENLNRHDLSVREIAAEVGVTERALQSAFKNFLGLSPTELIRRQRMERIRAELLSDSLESERSVLRIANKWGVQNRSTLVSGYRKEFQEAPSETLDR